MARNEIRLRKQSMTSGRIARYRNYEDLMARHEHDLRIRKLSRLIVYILIIVILICSFLALVLIKQQEKKLPERGKVPYTATPQRTFCQDQSPLT